MNNCYTDEFPLGYCCSGYDADIITYLSWRELLHSTRTGKVIRAGRSTATAVVDLSTIKDKQDRPCVVYKGDYQSYRASDHFRGQRSQYVFLDVDFDEKRNGMSKSEAMSDPVRAKRILDEADLIEFAISQALGGTFFCKRSSSRTGIHHVLRVSGMPVGLEDAQAIEKNVFAAIQGLVDHRLTTKYKFAVDTSAKSTARVIYLSHDPEAAYDPSVEPSPAAAFPVITEGSCMEYSDTMKRRDPADYDRTRFKEIVFDAKRTRFRFEYQTLFELSILYFQLWPEGKKEEFMKMFLVLNKGRADYRGNDDLDRMHDEGKKASTAKNKTRRIGMTRLSEIHRMIIGDPLAEANATVFEIKPEKK